MPIPFDDTAAGRAVAALLAAASADTLTARPFAELAATPPVEWLDSITREIDRACANGDGLFAPVVTDGMVRQALVRVGALALIGLCAMDRAAVGCTIPDPPALAVVGGRP